jgi:extracellular factor (EF) 3-hydroxypalmitic acid methyl ester biosynthesis protein
LGEATSRIENGKFFSAYRLLDSHLSELCNDAKRHDMDRPFTATARGHRLFKIVQQDPYMRRDFQKPRGYAGDAVMLDCVYDGLAPRCTSALGLECFAGTTRGPMGLSVLLRRCLLRAYLDQCVTDGEQYRILPIASGHCHELQGSLVTKSEFQGEFVALDQNVKSCD